MKLKPLMLCIAIVIGVMTLSRGSGSSGISGDYLGEEPPGVEAKVFAPGIVSTVLNEDGSPIFTPDGDEVFWRIAGSPFSTVVYMKRENGLWSEPEIAPFAGQYQDAGLAISPDGNRIYFASLRPVTGEEGLVHFNTWVTEKKGGAWSDPVVLGAPVDNPEEHYTIVSVSGDRTIYKQSTLPGGMGSSDIYSCRYVDSKYSEPVALPGEVNTEYREGAPCISPDGSYLLFQSDDRPDSYGSIDIYVSFRRDDGTWGEAVNLGERVNTEHVEKWPSITTDGKYLFFVSNRPVEVKYSQYAKKRKSLSELKALYEYFHRPRYEPGWGDVYWISTRVIHERRVIPPGDHSGGPAK